MLDQHYIEMQSCVFKSIIMMTVRLTFCNPCMYRISFWYSINNCTKPATNDALEQCLSFAHVPWSEVVFPTY